LTRKRCPAHPICPQLLGADQIGQFPDIGIAIAVEVDECGDIERHIDPLGDHRRGIVGKIVVAIDVDRSVRVGPDHPRQRLIGKVGERQVDRALDVPLAVSPFRAGIEQQRSPGLTLGLERCPRQPVRRADRLKRLGQRDKAPVVDLRIDRRGELRSRRCGVRARAVNSRRGIASLPRRKRNTSLTWQNGRTMNGPKISKSP
jgi:hypothetical protein